MNVFVTILVVSHVYGGFAFASSHHGRSHGVRSAEADSRHTITPAEIGRLIGSLPPSKGNEVYSTLMSIIPFLEPNSKPYSFFSSIPNVVQQQPSVNVNPYQLNLASVPAPYFMSSRPQMPPLFQNYFASPSPLGAHHHDGAPARTCFRHHGIFSPSHGFGIGLSSIITSYGTPKGNGKDNGISLLDLLVGDDDEAEENESDELRKGEKNKVEGEPESQNVESEDTSTIDNPSTETNEDNMTTDPTADPVDQANEDSEKAEPIGDLNLDQAKPETSSEEIEEPENIDQVDALVQPTLPSTETTAEQQPQIEESSPTAEQQPQIEESSSTAEQQPQIEESSSTAEQQPQIEESSSTVEQPSQIEQSSQVA